MDQKAVEAAGYDKGFEKGSLTAKIQFAQKLKSQGFDIEKIQELTELTIEEINNL